MSLSTHNPLQTDGLAADDIASSAFKRLRTSILILLSLLFLLVVSVAFIWSEARRAQNLQHEVATLEAATRELLHSYNTQGLQHVVEAFSARNGDAALRVIDAYESTVAYTGPFREDTEFQITILTDSIGTVLGQIHMQDAGYSINFALLFTLLAACLWVLVFCHFLLQRVTTAWLEEKITEPVQKMVQSWLSDQPIPARDIDLRSEAHLPSVKLVAAALETAAGHERESESRAKQAERMVGVLDNALSLKLEYCGEALLFMDDGDLIMRCPPSSKVSEEELQELSGLVASRKALPALLTEAGYQLLDMQASSLPYEIDRCFVERDEATEFEFNRFYGKQGQVMLTIEPARPMEWFEKIHGAALKSSKSGLVIFDTHGQLRQEIGESGRVMIPRLESARTYGLSDLLAHFPKLESFETAPIQTFDFEAETHAVHRIWMKVNAAGWVAIYHQDVTEVLQREKQLMESQRLKDLGEIASGIAHDFNNSLGVVIGQLQLAMGFSERQADERIDALNTAKQAADQASAVVAQLMSYSRKQVLNAKIVNIDRLIRDNQRVLATALTGKHSLNLDLRADHMIYIDPDYLSAAIMNLVINARDAMTKNGTVTISTRVHKGRDGGGSSVSLVVSDTGSGMPPHIQDKVFAPFFSTKPEGDGNGLGLSMVKGFVEQSNGSIDFESSITGTDMRITLPAIDAYDLSETKPSGPTPTAVISDLRVLLVDDDRLVLATQAALLRQSGMTTVECDSPFDALEILRDDGHFDVAIVDMQMPEMHGLDLATRFRQMAPDLPIIACSGNFDPENVAHAQTLKISKLVEKPASMETLRQAVLEATTTGPNIPKLLLTSS